MEISSDILLYYVLVALAVYSAHEAISAARVHGFLRGMAPFFAAILLGWVSVVALGGDIPWWRQFSIGAILGTSTLELGKYIMIPSFRLLLRWGAKKLGVNKDNCADCEEKS